jgi:hypothetical protein
MARLPEQIHRERPSRRRDTKRVIKPTGKFIPERRIHVTTQRSPASVTKINPDEMKPILPEMTYIPPQ